MFTYFFAFPHFELSPQHLITHNSDLRLHIEWEVVFIATGVLSLYNLPSSVSMIQKILLNLALNKLISTYEK